MRGQGPRFLFEVAAMWQLHRAEHLHAQGLLQEQKICAATKRFDLSLIKIHSKIFNLAKKGSCTVTLEKSART